MSLINDCTLVVILVTHTVLFYTTPPSEAVIYSLDTAKVKCLQYSKEVFVQTFLFWVKMNSSPCLSSKISI